jgi:hypothetical protein
VRHSKQEKARRREANRVRLRWKRYKGDHDYYWKLANAKAGGFRLLPFAFVLAPGIPIGWVPVVYGKSTPPVST